MDYRLERMLAMIEMDLSDCGPQQLARKAGLSISRFYAIFRMNLGMSPAAYIRSLRYSTARDLLLTTDYSVKEIAARIGIHDVSHFVRDFEKRYQLSPRRFRQQYWAYSGSPHCDNNVPTGCVSLGSQVKKAR